MTKENQKRLYEHFVSKKMTEQANAILKVYPEFGKPAGKPADKKEKTK